MLGLICLASGAKAVLFDTMDPDAFWHMRVGAQLQREGIGPMVDQISFSSIREPWTPYSWLAEIGMERVWSIGGFRAAVAVQALMAAGIMLLIGMSAREMSGGAGVGSIVGTAGAAFLSLPYLSFRPVTFAILLLAFCGWVLVRDRRNGERTRLVWVVIPVTALLANVHLYVVLIPLWILAMWVGALVERRRAGRYGVMLVLTVAGCCATPMFCGAVRSAVDYQFRDPMVHSRIIAEMQPFFQGMMGGASGVLVVMFLGSVVVKRKGVRVGEWVWMVGSTVLLLRWGRFAPVFAIVAGPMAAVALAGLSDRVLDKRAVQVAMAGLLVLGMFQIGAAFPARDADFPRWLNRHGAAAPGFPTGAAAYVVDHVPPVSGRVITDFTWGGYVGWRLGDGWQVLLDGRTQVYPPAFWRATYLGTEEERFEFLSTVAADAAVLPHHSLFHPALKRLGWRVAFSDEFGEVLTPPQVAH